MEKVRVIDNLTQLLDFSFDEKVSAARIRNTDFLALHFPHLKANGKVRL